MATVTISIRISSDLAEAVKLRTSGIGYRNKTLYWEGLARYDNLVQGDHSVTLPMANLSPEEQDKIDSQLLEVARRGVGERGQLLKRLLDKIKEDQGSASAAAIPDAIVGKKPKKKSP